MTPSPGLDRSNDGQDHTVSPYAGAPSVDRGSYHAHEVHLALHATPRL